MINDHATTDFKRVFQTFVFDFYTPFLGLQKIILIQFSSEIQVNRLTVTCAALEAHGFLIMLLWQICMLFQIFMS